MSKCTFRPNTTQSKSSRALSKRVWPNKGKKKRSRDIVNRLYDPNPYQYKEDLKRQGDQFKDLSEQSKCTFHPAINRDDEYRDALEPEMDQPRPKGYDKAVQRMQKAYIEKKIIKE